MGQRMKTILSYYAGLTGDSSDNTPSLSPEEAETARRELLIQIWFFQHERLVHLIVTVLFAVLSVITLLANIFLQQPLLFVLSLLFLILLIPYIRHYYLLENGVQKLYEYYDAL